MVYTRRKIQVNRGHDGNEYLTVSIPKLFGDIWADLGATHCTLEYNDDDNRITMFPEREKGGEYEKLN